MSQAITDIDACDRALALRDAIDMSRRAAAALLAASVDEQDMRRLVVLVRARRSTLDVLNTLTAIA